MTAPMRPEIDLSHIPLVMKLKGDHFGAAVALMDLLRLRRRVGEPMDADALWCLGALDTLNICGSDLAKFWHDDCDGSSERMIQVLRTCLECDGGLGCDDTRRAPASSTSSNQGAFGLIGRELVSEVPAL